MWDMVRCNWIKQVFERIKAREKYPFSNEKLHGGITEKNLVKS